MSQPAATPVPPAVAMTSEEAMNLLVNPPSPYALHRERISGVEFTVFTHAPRNLGTIYALSSIHDERTMLVFEDERYGFADVRQRAANLAHHMVHTLGVKKGDRVALAMRNLPEWCFTYMAATSIGAVIVPLNGWWTGPELSYGLTDCGATLLVADRERADRVLPLLPAVNDALQCKVLVARPGNDLDPRARSLDPLLEGAFALPAVDVAPDDDASIMYTSGSTGQPKGVVSTHRAVVGAVITWEAVLFSRLMTELPAPLVERIKAWLGRGAEAIASRPLDLPQASGLVTLPMFHVTGSNVQFLPAFRSGRKIVLMHKWNPERALELIEREKITDFGGVPTMSWELVNSPDFAKRDTSTLRSLSAGGAARPPEHVKRLREQAAHAIPSTGYGMTETNSLGSAIGGDDYALRPASVGKALPPLIELKVIDDAGRTLGPDEDGEICIKGSTNMRCYWNQPEETAKVLKDGWMHTGDLGHIDSEGFLFITGRAKDIVIRGGENISCPEVEHALYEHPAVFEAAVYGVPDERLGEALAATVRVREGHTLGVEELQAHVRARLASFKVPSLITLQADPWPRVGSEKIDKRSVRKQALAALAAR